MIVGAAPIETFIYRWLRMIYCISLFHRISESQWWFGNSKLSKFRPRWTMKDGYARCSIRGIAGTGSVPKLWWQWMPLGGSWGYSTINPHFFPTLRTVTSPRMVLAWFFFHKKCHRCSGHWHHLQQPAALVQQLAAESLQRLGRSRGQVGPTREVLGQAPGGERGARDLDVGESKVRGSHVY